MEIYGDDVGTALLTCQRVFQSRTCHAGPERDTQENVWMALDKATKHRQPMCVGISRAWCQPHEPSMAREPRQAARGRRNHPHLRMVQISVVSADTMVTPLRMGRVIRDPQEMMAYR